VGVGGDGLGLFGEEDVAAPVAAEEDEDGEVGVAEVGDGDPPETELPTLDGDAGVGLEAKVERDTEVGAVDDAEMLVVGIEPVILRVAFIVL